MTTIARRSLRILALTAFSGGLLLLSPVRSAALEALRLRLPLLESDITLELGDAETARDLLQVNPDLAELDRAGEGAVTTVLEQVLTAPLPQVTKGFLDQSAGQPLFEQALLAASGLIQVDGVAAPLNGRDLTMALQLAYSEGQPHLLGVLRRLPGSTASIDLQALLFYANRLSRHQAQAKQLIQAAQPQPAPAPELWAAVQAAGGWRRREATLVVAHRSHPLEIVSFQPLQEANGHVVVISHGLWDEPASFEAWAQWLASRGYTVLLPVHQGSDLAQQQAMLSGELPPPPADELRRRPQDVTALLDGVASGELLPGAQLNTEAVAMVGHSWGATTTLQVAGLRTTDAKLMDRCQDLRDPERNLSWVLQCSWLQSASDTAMGDPRIRVAVAVSPPLRLLFDAGSGHELTAPVLLVSGNRDWLVPSGPEAITPLRRSSSLANGHRLVLASGGGHFNLRGPASLEPPVLAPLIEAWINQTLQPEAALRFNGGRWGSVRIPLVDVTPQL